MNTFIRQEKQADQKTVESLIKSAFESEEYSDHTEHLLVQRLRHTDSFIPELSLVAELDNEILGHILFTKIQIISNEKSWTGLALAPVSVLPHFHKKGIGSQLIIEGHRRAKEMKFNFIILLGHEVYYPRFGYRELDKAIKMPFDAPRKNCFSLELIPNFLHGVRGTIAYDKAFLI